MRDDLALGRGGSRGADSGAGSGASSGASSGLSSSVVNSANGTAAAAQPAAAVQLQHGRGMAVADDGWNPEHSGPAVEYKVHKKHKFSPGAKDCAEINTERFADEQMVASDNWVGGFYMEVWVDGWDVDKTVTIDFHTPEIEFPKHACQNVRVRRAAWRRRTLPLSTRVVPSNSALPLTSCLARVGGGLHGHVCDVAPPAAALDLLRELRLRSQRCKHRQFVSPPTVPAHVDFGRGCRPWQAHGPSTSALLATRSARRRPRHRRCPHLRPRRRPHSRVHRPRPGRRPRHARSNHPPRRRRPSFTWESKESSFHQAGRCIRRRRCNSAGHRRHH